MSKQHNEPVPADNPQAATDAEFHAAMSAINGFADAVNLVRSVTGEEIPRASDLIGDGFALVDKKELLGKPLLILTWEFHEGTRGSEEFVTVRAVTSEDRKVLFNDGSTGIYRQLKRYTEDTDGCTESMLVSRGLRVSEYDYEAPSGEITRATTYYLDTSA